MPQVFGQGYPAPKALNFIVPLKQTEYGVYGDLISPKAVFYLLKGDYITTWYNCTVMAHRDCDTMPPGTLQAELHPELLKNPELSE